jgi:hypothetical protein
LNSTGWNAVQSAKSFGKGRGYGQASRGSFPITSMRALKRQLCQCAEFVAHSIAELGAERDLIHAREVWARV